ncbi:Uncharacterized protein dnm_083450 [Desulfonema magnum]|uniref:Uncharacterized protein n=1 Tax=Desulfonema magnum TaxID=45655 RepID=A0A975BV19_9BACT|nr:Uncharacterized protein dnm_083450 [Desulfonema magnum]
MQVLLPEPAPFRAGDRCEMCLISDKNYPHYTLRVIFHFFHTIITKNLKSV